jgi:hypothetical protein
MSDEKYSTHALELADDAEQKFDYFMTGLSAAIVGYIAPKLQPNALGLNPQTLELVSMLLFVGAVFAGFKRIEAAIQLRRAVGLRHQSTEFAAEIQDALRGGGEGQVVSVRDNTATPPEQLRRHQAEFVRRADERIKESQQLERVRMRWYSARSFAMVVGFLTLLAANLWKGYL